MTQENKHARLSASGSARWLRCTGSIQLTEQLITEGKIKERDNLNADLGTAAHELLEKSLSTKTPPRTQMGKTIDVGGYAFTVDQDMVDAVTKAYDYISGICKAHPDHILRLEEYCSLEYLNIPGMEGGTADVVLIYGGVLEIFDYKHGVGVFVDVSNNSQLMMYTLGALRDLPDSEIIEELEITIGQPRHSQGPAIRSSRVSIAELRDFEEQLISTGNKIAAGDVELVPGDTQCRFCPNAPFCPALFERTETLALSAFDGLEDTKIEQQIKTLTPEHQARLIENEKLITSYLKKVKAHVSWQMQNGKYDDYKHLLKLVRSKARRKYKENADFSLAEFYLGGGIYNKTPIGITEMEKALKKEDKEEAEKIMDAITEKPEGSLNVVPINAPGDPESPDLGGEFEGLETMNS